VRTILARGATALVLLAAVGAATAPAASAAAQPGGVQPASTISGSLAAVAATSASNAWAVGATVRGQALIVHWNGTSWARVTSHAPSETYLNSVAATSASNAWAVGGTGSGKPVILRWNGHAWTRVGAHLPSESYLTSVAAVSSRSAWIVGSHDASSPRTLVLHWNGKSWKQQRSPDPKVGGTMGDVLDSVSVVSSKDAWAVGAVVVRYSGPAGGLALHWNGKSWKQVSAKAVTGKASGLTGVAATSRSSAFAVGCKCAGGADGAVIGRWNGRSWAKAHVAVRAVGTSLSSVAATSSRSAWAVGEYCKSRCTTGSPDYQPLVLRWNGSGWKLSAAPVTRDSSLVGLGALSASSAWAVGATGTGKILILHWNGSSWKLSS
jgi:hypothetical protein